MVRVDMWHVVWLECAAVWGDDEETVVRVKQLLRECIEPFLYDARPLKARLSQMTWNRLEEWGSERVYKYKYMQRSFSPNQFTSTHSLYNREQLSVAVIHCLNEYSDSILASNSDYLLHVWSSVYDTSGRYMQVDKSQAVCMTLAAGTCRWISLRQPVWHYWQLRAGGWSRLTTPSSAAKRTCSDALSSDGSRRKSWWQLLVNSDSLETSMSSIVPSAYELLSLYSCS